jgi:hypothetical protein
MNYWGMEVSLSGYSKIFHYFFNFCTFFHLFFAPITCLLGDLLIRFFGLIISGSSVLLPLLWRFVFFVTLLLTYFIFLVTLFSYLYHLYLTHTLILFSNSPELILISLIYVWYPLAITFVSNRCSHQNYKYLYFPVNTSC